MAQELLSAFNERKYEVEIYIEFLQSLEDSAKQGPPKLKNTDYSISTEQQKILYSSVYLQLYNLVESTITRCIDAISNAATFSGSVAVKDLAHSLRNEWVRSIARTHIELTPDKRLKAALDLCNYLIENRPVTELVIEKGNGGNWDDIEIENLSKRIGINLKIDSSVYRNIKRPLKDGKGSLQLVKKLRNDLAHGSISFIECASEATVSELRELKERTVSYLHEVIKHFDEYIKKLEYLSSDSPSRQYIGK